MRVSRHWFFIPLIVAAVVILAAMFVSSSRKRDILAARTNLLIASQRYPKFTLAQRAAVLRELQSERHPKWHDLSLTEMARRLASFLMSAASSSQPPTAPFAGNMTTISVPPGDPLALLRQANCSLTLEWAGYTLTLPTVSYTIAGTTPNYDQILHNEAGLTTTGGSWPAGCGDPTLGITARTAVPFGLINGNMLTGAGVGYDSATDEQVIWTAVGSLSGGTNVPIGDLTISGASPSGAAAADFNGDGNTDLAVVNDTGMTGGSASIAILLGNTDGSLQSPVVYTLPGEMGLSAVIDDFNGDGKLDIVAASSSFSSGTTTYYLSFMAGKGDGTFQTPVSVTVTPPTAFSTLSGSVPYYGLISADLLGNGKKDLVTSGGVVLMGNGDGTFTQSATLAFPAPTATSDWGPNVVAADFNKDGKVDLATDNGQSISIYLGKGDGTFTEGNAYATISSIGYLNANDLDGDGNIDLYSGIARGGQFGGDKFEFGEAYALMGNGDGTFRGAPELPFVFTGTNLADLNNDKLVDGVGVNVNSSTSQASMTSYLGKGDGTFTTGPTLQISPVMIQGSSYSFSSLDSFGLGDVTGDGKTDLVYLPALFYGPGGVPGYFLATGNGDGSFNTPVFIPAPTFAPSGDFDQYAQLNNLFVADVNGDGKADLIYSYYVEVFQTGVYEQGIAVQLSNGDGTFQAPQTIQTYSGTTFPTGQPPAVGYIGDATGSGKLDLITLTTTTNTSGSTTLLQLYLGKGDGTFGSALTPPVADNINPPSFGGTMGQIVFADMNGDGKPDLVSLGSNSSQGDSELAISLGNGDGTFQTPTIIDFGVSSSDGYGLAVADFNGDGKLDVAVTGFDPPFDTGVFLGNGDGTLQTFTTAGGEVEPAEAINLLVYGTAQAVKLNGSGLPTLIAGGAVLVNQASTTPILTPTATTLTSTATNITAGQSVTFTATVTSSSTPSGTVIFNDGTTTLGPGTLNGSGVATYTTSGLSAGSHSITATYQGNSTFAASTSSPPTVVTVTAPALIGTTTNLSASATTVNAGASVTLNATVTPASGSGTPTGSVIFMDGSTALAMMSLSSGAASYSTSSLAVGTHSILAIYGGDTNYSGSTSGSVTVTVQALTPSFTIAASPTSGSVTAGTPAQTSITVTPVNGFNQQVSFACSGVSNGVTCSFNPTTVTPSGNTPSTTLTIATTSQSAALAPLKGGTRRGLRGAASLTFLAAGVLWFFRRRKDRSWLALLIVGVAMTIGGLGGCGSGSSSNSSGGGSQPQSANYTITVTATAGSETQTASYGLTVHQ